MRRPASVAGAAGLLRQALRFLVGAGAGLAVDLSLFGLLVLGGLAPGAANLVSAAVSVTVVYLVSTRYAFGTAMTWRSYALFVGWYALSIGTFSLLIQLVASATDWQPFLVKLLSIPPSFAANFLCSRALLHRPTATAVLP